MSDKDNGVSTGLGGIVEGVKGKAKEVAAAVVGDDSLRREGQAQQDKASSQREVAEKEAEAEKARLEASANEARQRAAERD
ncbi:CsbD family protein [Nocardia sp. NPDC058633]|uniref:microaggregate-binding protein 1 n=1 Tax=Nocardia sp. NPDC058633 TaxID=3346568 RepID=UPI0036535E90